MSLIHDALKKAQADSPKPGAPEARPVYNPIIPDTRLKIKWRMVLIGAGLIASFAIFSYRYFFHKPALLNLTPKFAAQGLSPATDQPPNLLKEQALQLVANNRYPEAKEAFEKLSLQFPTDPEIYNNLGLTLRKLGQTKPAYRAYERALALKKDYPEALNNLGVLYMNDGDADKAKELFQEALLLSPDYPPPYFHLGLVFEQEGNFMQARKYYEQFLQKNPAMPWEEKQKLEKKLSQNKTP